METTIISNELISKEEDTLYLSNIPELIDNINEIRKNEDWNQAKEFNPDEEW